MSIGVNPVLRSHESDHQRYINLAYTMVENAVLFIVNGANFYLILDI